MVEDEADSSLLWVYTRREIGKNDFKEDLRHRWEGTCLYEQLKNRHYNRDDAVTANALKRWGCTLVIDDSVQIAEITVIKAQRRDDSDQSSVIKIRQRET